MQTSNSIRVVLALGVLAGCNSGSPGDDEPAPQQDQGGGGVISGPGPNGDGGAVPDGVGADMSGPIDPTPTPSCPAGHSGPGQAPLGTVPGALTFPFPTLRNATILWSIAGDNNANGTVTVRYRKQGENGWHRALPLRRVTAGALAGFTIANHHTGSIFDLEPATTYEVELFLLDPDGGCELRMDTFTTRSVPTAMAGAPVKAVTPQTFSSVVASVKPGDILELGAGSYAGFSFAADGTAEKPIVIRGTAGAVVNGDISLTFRKYVHLTGLTVNGRIRFNASTGIVITKNIVNTHEHGIASTLRSESAYIADNVVTGVTTWSAASLGVSGNNLGEGIVVTGPGHVIEHNKVAGFRDNISLMEDSEAVDQYSIDIVENDINSAADDGVEADFCLHNCRIIRNRFTNVFMAMSSQPGLGGPTYFIRNVVYNAVLSAFKLQRGSIGDVLLHNTVIKSGDAFGVYTTDIFSKQYSRNNLFIGGPGGTFNGYSNGSGRVLALGSADKVDLDYDGLGSTTGNFTGRLGSVQFSSLAELRASTSEKHAVQVGLDVFAATISQPSNPFPARAVPDLRLKEGASALDVGVVLPNVNDRFTGAGPELGAYELGAPLPAYGPRG